jgi:hypothetical protein
MDSLDLSVAFGDVYGVGCSAPQKASKVVVIIGFIDSRTKSN